MPRYSAEIDKAMAMIPYLRQLCGDDVGFSVSTTDKYVLYQRAGRMDHCITPGDPVRKGGLNDQAMSSAGRVTTLVSADVFGFSYRGVGIPLMEGGRVVGSMTMFQSTDTREKLVHMTPRMNLSANQVSFADIIGVSPAIVDLKRKAFRFSFGDSTILITGESGTGKEVLTKAIHAASSRRDRAFVAINCGAIPESLLESELFGYQEGAFTGARKGGKPGKFELANHGTIFLDEIGNMPLYMQAKLLRVLQERQIERVGAVNLTPVDVRVIAATNRSLESMVLKGSFAQDLYYRLSVIPLHIPPLRERPEDIPLLLEHYRRYFNDRLGKNIKGFTEAALRITRKYDWPGNVRQLINAVEYAVNLTEGTLIDVPHLPAQLREPVRKAKAVPGHLRTLAQMERDAIEDALARFGWTDEGKSLAARVLGVSRATIYRKISRYGLTNRSRCGNH